MENNEVRNLAKEIATEMGLYLSKPKPTYVYGQCGLAELFGCSIATASRILASGRIAGAVSQIGRKIVVDAEKALELANQKSGGRKWKK